MQSTVTIPLEEYEKLRLAKLNIDRSGDLENLLKDCREIIWKRDWNAPARNSLSERVDKFLNKSAWIETRGEG